MVWTVEPTAVIFIWSFIKYGKVNLTRTVAIAGSKVKEPVLRQALSGRLLKLF